MHRAFQELRPDRGSVLASARFVTRTDDHDDERKVEGRGRGNVSAFPASVNTAADVQSPGGGNIQRRVDRIHNRKLSLTRVNRLSIGKGRSEGCFLTACTAAY
jgi:hypothetical protein